MAESGAVAFANTHLGTGEWTEIEAAVLTDPTGGYNSGELSCPGYSSPTVPHTDGTYFLYLSATWLGTGNQCQVRFGTGTFGGPVGQVTTPWTADKCLDADTNISGNGKAVQLWDCNTATDQRWSVAPDGALRAFGRCLDIDGNGTANFTKVQLWN